jgi:hypothetical protein
MTSAALQQVLSATGYMADELEIDRQRGLSAPQGIGREGSASAAQARFVAQQLWVVSPDRIDLYNGFGRPRPEADPARNRLATFRTIGARRPIPHRPAGSP